MTSDRRSRSWPVRDALAVRALFLLVGWLGYWIFRTDRASPRFTLQFFGQWDATNLLLIAERGYDDSVAGGNSAAFFPGFPLVVRGLRNLGFGTVTAGLLTTTVATCLAAWFLAELAQRDGHDPERSVLALLTFPMAVFLVAPYTEAMFLAATIPAFLYAKRGRSLPVAICVFIAGATRTVGVFVAAGAIIEFVRSEGWSRSTAKRAVGIAVAGAAPISLFAVHLQRTRGDFLEFARAQERGWGRSLTDPLSAFANSWRAMSADATTDFLVSYRLEIAFAAASVALLVGLIQRQEWGYVAYVGGTLAVAMTNVVYVSIPRFALTFFPFAFVVADLTPTTRRWGLVVAAMSSAAALGVVAFVNGHWVS